MFSFLAGSGIVKTVENIATEWIQTDKEQAEAKAVMIKALDPNGGMRRYISRVMCNLYAFYIISAVILIVLQAFGLTPVVQGEDIRAADLALENVKELFVPITTMVTMIVSASFGVNGINTVREKAREKTTVRENPNK